MRNHMCICRGKQSILFTSDMLGFLATYLNLSVDLSYFTSTSLLSSTQNSIKTESRLSYHLAVDGCLLNKEIYIDNIEMKQNVQKVIKQAWKRTLGLHCACRIVYLNMN